MLLIVRNLCAWCHYLGAGKLSSCLGLARGGRAQGPGVVSAHCRPSRCSFLGGSGASIAANFALCLGTAIKLESGRPQGKKSLQIEKPAVRGHPGADRFLLPPAPGPGAPPPTQAWRSHPETQVPGARDGVETSTFLGLPPPPTQILAQEDSHLHTPVRTSSFILPLPRTGSSLFLWHLC